MAADMSSPPKIPNTSGHHGGFVSELRLTNGVKNAADAELAKSVELCERAALWGAVIVIAGLVAEGVFAAIQTLTPIAWDTPEGTWGAVIADSLVALGVATEVFFSRLGMSRQRELQRRSDAKLGEATERAAQADLKRAELEAQLAPRVITKKQFDVLQTLRGKVLAVGITAISDFESVRFAAQIAEALTAAGLEVRDFDQRIGLVWTDLYIVVPGPIEDFRKEPLYSTFHAAGISVGIGTRDKTALADIPFDIPVIMVGEKKPLFPHPRNFGQKVRVVMSEAAKTNKTATRETSI